MELCSQACSWEAFPDLFKQLVSFMAVNALGPTEPSSA